MTATPSILTLQMWGEEVSHLLYDRASNSTGGMSLLCSGTSREFVAGWGAAGTHNTDGGRCVMPACHRVTGATGHLEAEEGRLAMEQLTSRAASIGIHGAQSGKGAELPCPCGGAVPGLGTHRNRRALTSSPEVLLTSATSWSLSSCRSGKLWGEASTLQWLGLLLPQTGCQSHTLASQRAQGEA